jgi:alpha-galactosidase
LRVERYGLRSGAAWVNEASDSSVFAVYFDGQRIDGQTEGLVVRRVTDTDLDGAARHCVIYLVYEPNDVEIENHTIVYPDSTLVERWLTVRNSGSKAIRIERLDSVSMEIPEDEYELMYYTSAWGAEFESIREPLRGERVLETRKGRSSNDQHPWFALFRSNGEILSASVMWSGNWIFRFESGDPDGFTLSGGLHDWEFSKNLDPGESVDSPRVSVVLGTGNDLNPISSEYARIGRAYWYPQNEFSQSLPVEWNHWFSYEDRNIDESVFKENADVAAELGFEVCTLDAGWFGPTNPSTHWYDYRGDWDMVNTSRFPSGIRTLSDYVHRKGMKFGLWCEIEALGQHARLAEEHPEFVALRSGERLGYVCFGNPAVQDWAFETLDRLITEYLCEWIKLDFNVDPGAGCNRTDHGHETGDGLYKHYLGYYRTLEKVRERHPDVILENCSSGGLRIDLGILKQTHLTFLSDPDWPEHGLQLIWGAGTMLAPEVLLHWGWSEWLHEHPHQTFNPRDPNLKQHQLDYYVRISMLGECGFSQRLPELPQWVADRFAHHIEMYKNQIRRFIRVADVYRLTEQPKRETRGDRWAGFQYSLPEGSEHLVFVFRLHGAEHERTLHLRDLEEDRIYTLKWLTAQKSEERSGSDLMRYGLTFDQLLEEDSAIILIR